MSDVPSAGRPRRALSHVGGETVVAGDERYADLLADAMDVSGIDADDLTHGFHSYPARMHYAVARRVLAGLCPDGGSVADPFCGSGTTLVEARRAGVASWGSDLNPLGVRLSRLKASRFEPAERAALGAMAAQVAERSEQRVRARVPVRARLSKQEASWYAPHILKELAGLLEEIEAVPEARVREALLMVFSSLVVKFSSQRADTVPDRQPRRLRKGLPTEFFLRKSEELVNRLAQFAAVASGPAPRVAEADARAENPRLVGRCDLVLSSPPYGGTYDYVEHHRLRFAWLGLTPSRFESDEIGARRHRLEEDRFEGELLEVLRACCRLLKPEGCLVWLMGDGEAGGRRVFADRLLESLSPRASLVPVAIASQTRPDFAGGRARREHLMLFRR